MSVCKFHQMQKYLIQIFKELRIYSRKGRSAQKAGWPQEGKQRTKTYVNRKAGIIKKRYSNHMSTEYHISVHIHGLPSVGA